MYLYWVRKGRHGTKTWDGVKNCLTLVNIITEDNGVTGVGGSDRLDTRRRGRVDVTGTVFAMHRNVDIAHDEASISP